MTEALQKILKNHWEKDGNVISLMQDTQEEFGYVPREAVDFFSDELGISPSRFYGVLTFYSQFHLNPRGKYVITVCCGTACHVKGSEKILNSLRRELELSEDKETTDDLTFSLEKVNCVGACSIAPVTIVDKKVHGKASSDKILKEVRSIAGAQQNDG